MRISEIGTTKSSYTIVYSEKFEDVNLFIKNNIRECEIAQTVEDRAKTCKELFEYIVNEKIFKHPRFNENCKFRATVWNKLFELDENVPGPYNPKDWIPIAKEKLSFLGVVCDTTGKNGYTDWDLIP